jgi:hypothetical protein
MFQNYTNSWDVKKEAPICSVIKLFYHSSFQFKQYKSIQTKYIFLCGLLQLDQMLDTIVHLLDSCNNGDEFSIIVMNYLGKYISSTLEIFV